MSLALQLIVTVLAKLPKPIREAILPDMRIPPIANDPSKVQLARPGHIYVDHPDLDEFAKFAADFGFVEEARAQDTIYYRGYGRDPYVYVASRSKDGKPRFRGAAFVAASQEEFDKVGPYNKPFEKPRQGAFQRYHAGPALVHKLGHYGYVVPDFDAELSWYTSHFNFVPSDILHHWDFDNMDVMTFMHLDLGEDFSDHHSFFMQRAEPHVKKAFCHHTSFEVADFDTQLLGHDWLAKRGWHSVWGVGRHVLGSQIFDYWADPSGFKIEHYADGDVVNRNTPTSRDVVGPFSIWGPEVPKDFGDKIPKDWPVKKL